MQAELRDTQAIFESLFESAPDGMILVDGDGRIVRMNAPAEALFGYSRQELAGKPVESLIPERYRERHRRHRAAYDQDPRPRPMGLNLELFGRRSDGSEFPVDITLSPVAQAHETLVMCVIRDVSERQRTDAELRAGRELLRMALTGAPLILWVVDRRGVAQVLGGKGMAAISPRLQEHPQIQAYVQRALAGEHVAGEFEVDGVFLDTRCSPILNEQSEVVGVSGVSIDVTERMRAAAERRRMEEELRDSEARFRTFFVGAAIGISLIEPDGKIVVTNPAWRQMLGYSPEELRGMDSAALTHPADAALYGSRFQELIDGERELVTLEQRVLRKDGEVIWVNLTVSPVREADRSTRFAISMIEDITARKQVEAELEELKNTLAEGQELERVHLAQELHDQPLQDLYGLIYQLDDLRDKLQGETGQEVLTQVKETAEEVVGALRAICGELRPPSLAPFGLEGAIREHAERLQELHPELRINLDLMYDGRILSEKMRLTLFRIYQQAMANVIRHAEASKVDIRFAWDLEQVVLEIRDDGRGFSVPRRWVDLARRGHLGLAGAADRAGIIQGRLEVVSAPGAGTLIRVTAPRAEAQGTPTDEGRTT